MGRAVVVVVVGDESSPLLGSTKEEEEEDEGRAWVKGKEEEDDAEDRDGMAAAPKEDAEGAISASRALLSKGVEVGVDWMPRISRFSP